MGGDVLISVLCTLRRAHRESDGPPVGFLLDSGWKRRHFVTFFRSESARRIDSISAAEGLRLSHADTT